MPAAGNRKVDEAGIFFLFRPIVLLYNDVLVQRMSNWSE